MITINDLALIAPEIFLFGMICVILIVDLFLSEQRRGLVHFLSVLTLVLTGVITWRAHGGGEEFVTQTAFSGSFVRDQMGDVLKGFMLIISVLVLTYAKSWLRQRDLFKGEYYVLILCAVLGMMFLVSAGNLIMLYLGLELLALSSYALVAMQRDSAQGSEAAMKYFVLGALASGMLLYGMSMIYGATGSLDLTVIASRVAELGEMNLILSFGLVFVVVGLAFKLGAVPFHMWLPDVYQGAPTAVTLFIASAPKLAAFGMAIRLLDDGLGGLIVHWQGMLAVLAFLSLALGNIVAIAQSNLKRMLAYSTISHVGFLLLGLLSGTADGYGYAMFYTICYSIMTVGAFGMIILLSRAGFEAENISDFKGLNRRHPWYALMMLFLMGSLAGFPPFLGFWAKLMVLKAAVDAGFMLLAISAVVFAVIGAFYYLRVIWVMYFEDSEGNETVDAPGDLRLMVSLNALAQLGLVLFVGPLTALCLAAMVGR